MHAIYGMHNHLGQRWTQIWYKMQMSQKLNTCMHLSLSFSLPLSTVPWPQPTSLFPILMCTYGWCPDLPWSPTPSISKPPTQIQLGTTERNNRQIKQNNKVPWSMRTLRLVHSEERFGVGWHAAAHLDVYMHFLWIGDDLWWHSFQKFACWFQQIIVVFFTFHLWATSMFLNRFVLVTPPSTIRLLQHQFAPLWCTSTYPLRSKKACFKLL